MSVSPSRTSNLSFFALGKTYIVDSMLKLKAGKRSFAMTQCVGVNRCPGKRRDSNAGHELDGCIVRLARSAMS